MKKITFITCGILLFIILVYMISGLFLSCKKPVKSSYVLLEDWISHTIAEDASDFFIENTIDSIFVVGMKSSNTPLSFQEIDKTRKLKKNNHAYAVKWNGVLGFEIPSENLINPCTLHVTMRGTGDINHFPHYEIFVNKQVMGTGFVSEKDSCYEFILSDAVTDSLTYVLINFDNDKSASTGDRNLYIAELYIDSMNIDSISTDNFFISKSIKPNINYISKLNTIKYYLEDLGYDTSIVKLVEVNYDPFNKSLALAKGAKKYFSNTEVKNINIITAKKHSRRSYLNFKNCLEENMEVGCIPNNSDILKRNSFTDGIDERVSLVLTWIYWWLH